MGEGEELLKKGASSIHHAVWLVLKGPVVSLKWLP